MQRASELLAHTLLHLAQQRSSRQSGEAPTVREGVDAACAQSAAEPRCPRCQGAGYVRLDVAVGHPAFGKALACACKQAKKNDVRRQRLRAQSGVDQLAAFQEASFETFDEGTSALQQVYEAAWQFAQQPQGWLVLAGGSGTGKTHLAVSIAKWCLDEGIMTLVAVVPDLLDELRASFADGAEEGYPELFKQLKEVELLVLDDLGAEHRNGWGTEKLFQLLNARYNARKATVITTNEVGFAHLEPRLRSRLSDRRLVQVVDMGGIADYRPLAEEKDEKERGEEDEHPE